MIAYLKVERHLSRDTGADQKVSTMQNLGKEISRQKEQNVQRLEVGVVFSSVF